MGRYGGELVVDSQNKNVYEKFFQFVGENVHNIDQNDEKLFFFRIKNEHVYLVRDDLIRYSSSLPRVNLISYGTCVGKFSHSGRFHLTIGALDMISQHSLNKVWLHRGSELKF